MRTLGVDLASQPKKTAACIVEWDASTVRVSDPVLDLTNRGIVDLAKGCDAIGIDSPFGWPRPFVDFITQAHTHPRQAASLDSTESGYLVPLCFRRTDRHIRQKFNHQPLSVSCDKLAMPAMLCVELLDLLGVSDRSGDGRVYEVYPAIALKSWDFSYKGYKKLPIVLTALLQTVLRRCPWLHLSEKAELLCSCNHDAFDALLSSLVTRAAYLGLTERPPTEELETAKLEGWIAVPDRDSLGKLPEQPPASARTAPLNEA